MHETSCFGVMSASSFHTGLRSDFGVQVPHRVDDRRQREMDDAFLGSQPAQLRVVRQLAPEAREVGRDVVQAAADDKVTKRIDRGDDHFVARVRL